MCGGDGMASFMMGQLIGGGAFYEIQFEVASENYQYAGFTQDNWKVTPKLTLNLGLRYDVSMPRTERHDRMNWFDPNVASLRSPCPDWVRFTVEKCSDMPSVRIGLGYGLERFPAAFRLRLSAREPRPFCAEVTASTSASPARERMAC